MKIKVSWVIFPLILTLSGCSAVNRPSSNVETGIETGTYALGIVWNHHIYDANESGISTVGKQLGRVTQIDIRRLNQNDSSTVSNTDRFPVGSKIYQVPGKNVSQVIAVQEVGGKYVQIEADAHN